MTLTLSIIAALATLAAYHYRRRCKRLSKELAASKKWEQKERERREDAERKLAGIRAKINELGKG